MWLWPVNEMIEIIFSILPPQFGEESSLSVRIRAGSRFRQFLSFIVIDVKYFRVCSKMCSSTPRGTGNPSEDRCLTVRLLLFDLSPLPFTYRRKRIRFPKLCVFWYFEFWTNLVILSVIQHRQNPLDSSLTKSFLNTKHGCYLLDRKFRFNSIRGPLYLTVSLNVLVYASDYDRLCGLVVRVLGYRFGGPGSIPGTTSKKKSSVSGTGSTQPREYNWGATW
jgi:hypothetical protein